MIHPASTPVNPLRPSTKPRTGASALLRRLAVASLVVAAVGTSSPALAQVTGGQGDAIAPPSDVPRPGDLIRLRIWREPELSGEFPVNENGVVVLPRIGPVEVRNESPASLQEKLTGRYRGFLSHSSVEVTLMRRLQILGAVRNPGLYPVDATMTLSDALALAGGTTPQGRPDRVELIRGGERVQVRLSRDTPIAGTQIRSGDQLFVPERNWLSRNPGLLLGGISTVLALIRIMQ